VNRRIFLIARYFLLSLALGVTVLAASTPGMVITQAVGPSPESKRILLQPDGKILVFGSFGEKVKDFDQFLVRLNQNGTLDKSFGRQGVIQDNRGGTEIAAGAVLQPDGKIVTLASSEVRNPFASRYVLVRYNRDGTPDRKFGQNGRAILKLEKSGEPVGISLLPNGDFLVGGSITVNKPDGDFNYAFTLVRFKSNGKLDASYGTNGRVAFEPTVTRTQPTAMHLQPDGKAVMAGINLPDLPGDFSTKLMVVVRFLPNGRLDSRFGNGGTVQRNFTEPAVVPLEIRSLKNGQLLIAGAVITPKYEQLGVVRLMPNGLADPSFGEQGLGLVPMGDELPVPIRAQAFDLQADGKMILVGDMELEKNRKVGLIRFLSSGKLDSSFAANGVRTSSLESQYPSVQAVAVQSNGKIVLAGFTYRGEEKVFALVRYLPDGLPDPTFVAK
jgi:uncharacterized delta-60 repeat protein